MGQAQSRYFTKVDERGFPIHDLLASEFGVIFILGYVVSYMLVSMGIFNVILGVYVEITMKARHPNVKPPWFAHCIGFFDILISNVL